MYIKYNFFSYTVITFAVLHVNVQQGEAIVSLFGLECGIHVKYTPDGLSVSFFCISVSG